MNEGEKEKRRNKIKLVYGESAKQLTEDLFVLKDGDKFNIISLDGSKAIEDNINRHSDLPTWVYEALENISRYEHKDNMLVLSCFAGDYTDVLLSDLKGEVFCALRGYLLKYHFNEEYLNIHKIEDCILINRKVKRIEDYIDRLFFNTISLENLLLITSNAKHFEIIKCDQQAYVIERSIYNFNHPAYEDEYYKWCIKHGFETLLRDNTEVLSNHIQNNLYLFSELKCNHSGFFLSPVYYMISHDFCGKQTEKCDTYMLFDMVENRLVKLFEGIPFKDILNSTEHIELCKKRQNQIKTGNFN